MPLQMIMRFCCEIENKGKSNEAYLVFIPWDKIEAILTQFCMFLEFKILSYI